MEQKITPITRAIQEFENMKYSSKSMRDIVYLEGILAVLNTIIPYEKEIIEEAHMAGQKDAGVDPSYHSALAHYTYKLSTTYICKKK